jgi:hypothetical protein
MMGAVTTVTRVARTFGGDTQLVRDAALAAPPVAGVRVDLRRHGGGLLRVEDIIVAVRGDDVGLVPPGVTAILGREPEGTPSGRARRGGGTSRRGPPHWRIPRYT